jgi:hypothetical protein
VADDDVDTDSPDGDQEDDEADNDEDDYQKLTVLVSKDDPVDQKRVEASLQIRDHLAPGQEIDDLQLGEERPHPSGDRVWVVAKYTTRPKGGSYSGGVRVY